MSVIRTPDKGLIDRIVEVSAVEMVAIGSNPSAVKEIMAFLPKDFNLGNYAAENVKSPELLNVSNASSKKDIGIV